MKPLLLLKEYKKLLNEKERASEALRRFLVARSRIIHHGNALEDIAKLGLRGGPKDLSSRLDFYLYR